MIFDGIECVSEPFEETPWQQSSPIVVDGKPRGAVEVYYLEERSELDEGPFLNEERNLIDGLAQALARMVERKQAEQKLGNSEASLAGAQRIAHLGNWDWDIEKDELVWSDEIYRIFGLQPQEFGATYEAFLSSIHPDDRALVKETVARALSGEGSYGIDHRVVRPDGTERTVGEQGQVSYDETGQPIRMVGTVHDITERQQTEEKLRQTTERLRTLVDRLADAIFVIDMEGRILEVNNQTCESLGYTRGELLELNMAEVDGEVVTHEHRQRFWAQLTPEQAMTIEGTQRRKDGTTFPVEVRLALLKSRAQRRIIGLARDITERKQAEEALQEAYQRNETILQTSMDGVMIMRPDGSIIECNEALCEMAGYSQDELVDMNIGDLEAHLTAEEVGEVMQQVMQAGSQRFETAIRRKDGTLVDLDTSTTFVELPENSFFVSFARDITETKKLWQELNHQLVRDSLTGVYNRRYFNETIIQEVSRADRYGHHVSFIMGDIDDLKAVNDNCGHLVGDQVLQGTAHALEQASRAADIVIRYGGDEFLVVMPETNTEQAHIAVGRFEQAFSEWLDKQVQAGALHRDVPADLGFSMGVACYQPDTDVAVEEVLAQADAAMYQVKQAKRAQRATA